jgi:hypothetical protein
MKNIDIDNNLFSLLKLAIISVMVPICIHLVFKNRVDINEPSEPKPFIKTDVDDSVVKLKDIVDDLIAFNNELIQTFNTNTLGTTQVKVLKKEEKTEQNNNEKETFWINSPVTQAWTFDEKKQTWVTVLPFKESMRSTPLIHLGLRSDGMVVWKKVNE